MILGGMMVLGLAVGCKKERDNKPLPVDDVYFTIPLSLPEYASLRVPGGIFLAKGEGYAGAGVYVVRVLSPEELYTAYDATCPNHLDKVTMTQWKEGDTEVVCPHCERVYNLLNGGSTHDGNIGLQPYRTNKEGTLLHIYP